MAENPIRLGMSPMIYWELMNRSMPFIRLGALALVCLMAGCATSLKENIGKVRVGMEKDQVLDLLGGPMRTRRVQGQDRWTYVYYENQNQHQTEFRFRHGQVVKIAKVPARPQLKEELRDAATPAEYRTRVNERKELHNKGFKKVSP